MTVAGRTDLTHAGRGQSTPGIAPRDGGREDDRPRDDRPRDTGERPQGYRPREQRPFDSRGPARPDGPRADRSSENRGRPPGGSSEPPPAWKDRERRPPSGSPRDGDWSRPRGATTASALVTGTTSLAARARAPRGARNAGQPADRSAHPPHRGRAARGHAATPGRTSAGTRSPSSPWSGAPASPRRNEDIVIPPEPPERGHERRGPAGLAADQAAARRSAMIAHVVLYPATARLWLRRSRALSRGAHHRAA